MAREKQGEQSEPDYDLPDSVAREAREALSAAGKAFDDLAQERMLPPYAEWARDSILEAQGNPVEFVEMFSGPRLEYAWFATVTRDPTPQGLDGGRVRSFDLVKIIDRQRLEAPHLTDPQEQRQWLEEFRPVSVRSESGFPKGAKRQSLAG